MTFIYTAPIFAPKSLRFFVAAGETYGQIHFPVDGGQAHNQGASSFNNEFWIRASGDNNATGTQGVVSNLIFDRDMPGGATGGQYLVGIIDDSIIISIDETGLTGYEDHEGTTLITDDVWNWIVWQYNPATGALQCWVNCNRELDITGIDIGSVAWESGGDAFDRRLVCCQEKSAIPQDGYIGYLGEWRGRSGLGYANTATIRDGLNPTSALGIDGTTVFYHTMEEDLLDSTNVIDHVSGSNGTLQVGGDPIVTPVWSLESPY